jgi:hypothetical protein
MNFDDLFEPDSVSGHANTSVKRPRHDDVAYDDIIDKVLEKKTLVE